MMNALSTTATSGIIGEMTLVPYFIKIDREKRKMKISMSKCEIGSQTKYVFFANGTEFE